MTPEILPWKSAAFVTLGCRLNQADSALLAGRLASAGIRIEPEGSREADIFIVNSCAVTAAASRKSRQILRSLRKEHPDSLLILTGCSAGDPALSTAADLLLSNEGKKDILEQLRNYSDRPVRHLIPYPEEPVFRENTFGITCGRAKAGLKIQEGCSNFCSYCIVPYTRGRERSRDLNEVLAEFQHLLDQGFREITLTGINTCTYHSDGTDLPGLLKKLLSIPGDFRIRIGSTEPGEILYRVTDVMASSEGRICEFLHPSLQHGSDPILKAMNRHYLTADYLRFAEYARKRMPLIHLGTDVITGFPGETEELFRDSCRFIEQTGFANMHIFPFSPRKGTRACTMKPKVPESVSAERAQFLRTLKEKMAADYRKRLLGTRQVLLAEQTENGWSEGWTGTYVRARVRGGSPGELIPFTAAEENLVQA